MQAISLETVTVTHIYEVTTAPIHQLLQVAKIKHILSIDEGCLSLFLLSESDSRTSQ